MRPVTRGGACHVGPHSPQSSAPALPSLECRMPVAHPFTWEVYSSSEDGGPVSWGSTVPHPRLPCEQLAGSYSPGSLVRVRGAASSPWGPLCPARLRAHCPDSMQKHSRDTPQGSFPKVSTQICSWTSTISGQDCMCSGENQFCSVLLRQNLHLRLNKALFK